MTLVFLLSPSKGMEFDDECEQEDALKQLQTTPPLIDKIAPMLAYLKKLSAAQIATQMGVNLSIASTVEDYFERFDTENATKRPALFGFRGMAYKKVDTPSLDMTALKYLCSHLIICDPMYGMLRASDEVQPYRLELACPLTHKDNAWVKQEDGKVVGIREYWGLQPTNALLDHLSSPVLAGEVDDRGTSSTIIINTASDEYYHLLKSDNLEGNGYRIVKAMFRIGPRNAPSVILKHARGLLVRYGALHQCQSLEDLKSFDLEGWTFEDLEDASIVFSRPDGWKPPPQAKAKAKGKAKGKAKSTLKKVSTKR